MSAARRYRPVPPTTIGSSPFVDERIDLGVCELRVLPGAELRIDRQERDQSVLELGPLGGPGRSGQHLESCVDLEGVGRHRDRPLAEPAQALRDRDRHGGLADPGRAEQRDDLRAWHVAQYREAIEPEVLK